MPLVYAVVHNGIGDFLIFRKNADGYFFHDAAGGGAIVVNGQPLRGGGNYAFPGGTPDDQSTVLAGALEEMLDETGVNLTNCATYPAEYYANTPQGEYYGVYFDAGNDMDDILDVALQHLNIGQEAAQQVIDGNYTASEYIDLMHAYPASPADNELQRFGEVWNMFAQWDEIEALNAPPTDWFYNMIVNLYEELFPVQVYDAHNNLVGAAQSMALEPGNVLIMDCLLYNPGTLLPEGEYRAISPDEEYDRITVTNLGGQQNTAEFLVM